MEFVNNPIVALLISAIVGGLISGGLLKGVAKFFIDNLSKKNIETLEKILEELRKELIESDVNGNKEIADNTTINKAIDKAKEYTKIDLGKLD